MRAEEGRVASRRVIGVLAAVAALHGSAAVAAAVLADASQMTVAMFVVPMVAASLACVLLWRHHRAGVRLGIAVAVWELVLAAAAASSGAWVSGLVGIAVAGYVFRGLVSTKAQRLRKGEGPLARSDVIAASKARRQLSEESPRLRDIVGRFDQDDDTAQNN